jgi:hypothetical protein
MAVLICLGSNRFAAALPVNEIVRIDCRDRATPKLPNGAAPAGKPINSVAAVRARRRLPAPNPGATDGAGSVSMTARIPSNNIYDDATRDRTHDAPGDLQIRLDKITRQELTIGTAIGAARGQTAFSAVAAQHIVLR